MPTKTTDSPQADRQSPEGAGQPAPQGKGPPSAEVAGHQAREEGRQAALDAEQGKGFFAPQDNRATPESSPSDYKDSLRGAEEDGGLDKPGGDGDGEGDGGSSSTKGYDPSNIKGREQFADKDSRYNAGGDQASKDKDSKYNPDGDKDRRFGKARDSFDNFKGKAGALAKNKWLAGGVAFGGGGMVILIILLVLLAGSLKIPNLAQHIAEYQMARVVRQFTETTNKITDEKLAIDSVDQASESRIKANYERLRKNTWGRMDKYRPERVIKNMKGSEQLKLNYGDPNSFGRKRLESVTIKGTNLEVANKGSTALRFIPGISDAIQFKNNITFSRDFSPILSEAIKDNKVGPVIRGQIARKIRQELGISLVAWRIADYANKKEAKAKLQAERDAYKAIAEPGHEPALTATINDATEKVDEDTKAIVTDDAQLAEATNKENGGLSPKIIADIEDKTTLTGFQNTVAFANSSYAAALAACIIYDGSLTQSGGTIDAASASQQRAYYYTETAADQQKRGETSGEAVGGFNDKLGDISPSTPEIRAATGQQDSSTSVSAEASAGGELSIAGALFGDNIVGNFIDTVFRPLCPTFTNIYVASFGAIILGVGTLIPGFGEGLTAAKLAVNEAVDVGVSGLTKRLLTNVLTKAVNKQATNRLKANTRFIVKDTVKSGAKVAALTILAKLVVMSKSHSMNNGLEQDQAFADEADAGGNLHGNTLEQRQFYGRPLTTPESAADQKANNQFVVDSHKHDSAFTRYFAVSNPDSLLNRLATITANTFHASIFSSFINMGGRILSPAGAVNNLFGAAFMPHALAAAKVTPTDTFYGNVQWGYSQHEMDILRTDFSYRPLENQSILDLSAKEDDIDAKYGECFDGSKSMGDMLSEKMIVRDEDGNVDPDKGLCAPNHLSSENDEFGNQMVFRWRVANNYDNGLDQVLDEQDVTDPAAAGAGGAAGAGAAGSPTATPATPAATNTGGFLVLFNDAGRYDRALISVDTSKGTTVGGVPNTEANCNGTVISAQNPKQIVVPLNSNRVEVPCSASSFFVNFFKPGQSLTDRGPQNNNGRVAPSVSNGFCTFVHRSGITRTVAVSGGSCPQIDENAVIEQFATKLTAKYTPSPIIIGQSYTYQHELSLASGDPMSPVECAGDIVITHIPDGGVGPRNYPMLFNPETKTCTFFQQVTADYSATLGPKREQLKLVFAGNSYLKPTSVIINHVRIRP